MIKILQNSLFSRSIVHNIKYFSSEANNLIHFEKDFWNSVHASIKYVPNDYQQFIETLKFLELQWKNNKMKAVWLTVNVDQVELLKETLNQGYVIHHATKEHITLSKWLLDGEKNSLPNYASHYVGCGGAVINSKNEVLMVCEKYGYNKTTWSFPGGRADPNEEIYQTAEREVFEELGIKVKAVDLLLLRESTKSIFNKPDIYFAFIMKPEDENPVVKMCTRELSDYTWVPISKIEEFMKEGNVSTFHVQTRILERINELYKEGFNFQKDIITSKIQYKNYPKEGINYTITEMGYPKKQN